MKPDSVRARPSTLINSDAEYKKIFSLDMPIDVYLKVIQIMKVVENYLKPDKCGKQLERKVITNIKYYVAMMVGVRLLDSKTNIAEKLAQIPAIVIKDDVIESALEEVLEKYDELGATEQVAKGSVLVAQLLDSKTL